MKRSLKSKINAKIKKSNQNYLVLIDMIDMRSQLKNLFICSWKTVDPIQENYETVWQRIGKGCHKLNSSSWKINGVAHSRFCQLEIDWLFERGGMKRFFLSLTQPMHDRSQTSKNQWIDDSTIRSSKNMPKYTRKSLLLETMFFSSSFRFSSFR